MTSTPNEPTNEPAVAGREEHAVIFRLGGEFYAVDIHSVQEIVRMQAITAVPGTEPWVEGITNLRGRVVPVIDLRVRCGLAAAEHTAETRIVVAASAGGMVGLIVDAVTEVMRIPGEQIEAPRTFAGLPGNGWVRSIAKLDDRLVSLMDLEALLPSGEELAEEREPNSERAAA
ncbi:MAG: chemotaxis protein CheW [Hyphomicrobiales bacterium]